MMLILSKLTARGNSTKDHGRERPAWYYLPYALIVLVTMAVLVVAISTIFWPDDGVLTMV
ncbi:MAG TPA: hypothetical protein PLH19_07030 [Anaerolineae bacterium]|nr:hypothetical protein [Anaerolineae bacterium]HQH38275.1 hypothetical protein [Anaerolineae bacterium]